MTAWAKLTPKTAPVGRAFLVRSKGVPIGHRVGEYSVAVAQRGDGSRGGLWALNIFWPDRPRKAEAPYDSRLWTEFAELPE